MRAQTEDVSAAALVSRLVNDVTALMRNELALAKAEFARVTDNARAGMLGIAISAVVFLTGVLSLVAAAILALAQVVAAWAAALIIGIALAAIGFVLLQTARKKLDRSALSMERTQHSLKQDAAVVTRRTL